MHSDRLMSQRKTLNAFVTDTDFQTFSDDLLRERLYDKLRKPPTHRFSAVFGGELYERLAVRLVSRLLTS